MSLYYYRSLRQSEIKEDDFQGNAVESLSEKTEKSCNEHSSRMKKSRNNQSSHKDYLFRNNADSGESIEQPSFPFRSLKPEKQGLGNMNPHGKQHFFENTCVSFDESSNATNDSRNRQSVHSYDSTSTAPSMVPLARAPERHSSIYDTMERLQPQRSIVKIVPDGNIPLPGAYRNRRSDEVEEEISTNMEQNSHSRGNDNITTSDVEQPTSNTNRDLRSMNTNNGASSHVQEEEVLDETVKEKSSIRTLRATYIVFVLILLLSIGIGVGFSFFGSLHSDSSSDCSMTDIESACSMNTSSSIEIPACLDELVMNLQRNFPSQSFSLQNRPDDDLYDDLVCHPENLAILSVALHSRNIVSRQAILQRYGLSILYFTTKGFQWKRNDNWVSEKSHCEWHGISCSETEVDVVTGITLDKNNLKGSIPSNFLTLLPTLKYLTMSVNGLSGTIPPQVSELLELRLGSNSLVGTLPLSLLRSNVMQVLSLEYNLRLEIPVKERFFAGPNWKKLELGDILFNTTFPNTFGSLPNLEVLKMEEVNLIGTIPPWISLLTKLTLLSIPTNRVTGTIPTHIGRMTNLRKLDMGENQLIGTLPTEIGYLSNLIEFVVDNNNINGTLPIQLTKLTQLTKLDFMENKLSGTLSGGYGGLTNLKTFLFAPNDFSGEVPIQICDLKDRNQISEFGVDSNYDCKDYGKLTCPVSHPSCCCPS